MKLALAMVAALFTLAMLIGCNSDPDKIHVPDVAPVESADSQEFGDLVESPAPELGTIDDIELNIDDFLI